ncbi:hypothetical protein ABTX60_07335 [Streptomyces sp. NPDC126510]|uniref:hypothetical protein n=1 Tax=Streptomyces sp. NPDC126510 TaxID=3155317 RepID=UPI003333EDED
MTSTSSSLPNGGQSYGTTLTDTAPEIIAASEVDPTVRSAARHFRFSGRQFFAITCNFPEATPDSVVLASVCELSPTTQRPFLGGASVQTFNVVPENGKVVVSGRIWWDSNLLIRVSLFLA